MKIYEIRRTLLVEDFCYVEAKNQKDAVEKAESGIDFVVPRALGIDKVPGWDTGDAIKVSKSKAKLTEYDEVWEEEPALN